ncbi:TPA: hypothetical protein EYP13_02495 [Candidatus Micrarchaeota archaeon]|nr:hypothetical protein [Candidatus Micrarchaeota archaeon]
MERVDVVGRILRIFPPRVFKKDGRTGKYCRLIVGDETGTIRLTLWNRDVSLVEHGKLESGQVIEVINGYVREYNGEPVLTLSFDSRIVVNPEVEDAGKLPEAQNVLVKVKDLMPDMQNVDVVLKVVRLFPARSIKREDGETEMRAFIGADETGSVRVVLWGEKARINLREGDVVKIVSGYTREGLSGVNIHVGKLGLVQIRNDLKEEFSNIGKVVLPKERKHVSELEEGDKFAEVRGTVVQVYRVKPVTAICNSCGAKAEWKDGKWVCPQCEGEDVRVVPILAFELDDGTGSIRVIAFDRQAAKVYGEHINPEVELHEIAEKKMLGEEVVVSGYVRRNKYFDNLELVAKVIREPNWDHEIKRMLSEVEGLLGEKGK